MKNDDTSTISSPEGTTVLEIVATKNEIDCSVFSVLEHEQEQKGTRVRRRGKKKEAKSRANRLF